MNQIKRLDIKYERILIFAIMAVAVWLRLRNLLVKGLWVDEIFTAVFAYPDHGFGEIYKLAINTPIPSPPFIFWVTNIFMRLFGLSETVVRMPSIIAGGLGIAAIYYLGKELLNREAGFIGALLLTVSAQHLYYSREARYYAFLMLFSVLTMIFFNRALDTNQRKSWFWFGVFTLSNILTHLSGFFVLAAQGLYLLGSSIHGWIKKPEERKKIQGLVTSFVIVMIVVGLFFSPLIIPIKESFTGERGFGDDDGNVRNLSFSLRFFLRVMADFGAGNRLPLWTFLGLATLGVYWAARKHRNALIQFASMTITPFVIIAILQPKHWFELKYIIFILPLYLLFVGLGVCVVSDTVLTFTKIIAEKYDKFKFLKENKYYIKYLRPLAFTGIVLILLLMGYGNLDKGYIQRNDPYSAVGKFLDRVYTPGDAVAVYPRTNLLTMGPEPMIGYYFLKPGDEERKIKIVNTVDQIEQLVEKHSRVWFYYQGGLFTQNLVHLREWVATQEGVSYNFGYFRLFYTGKNATQEELVNEAYFLDVSEQNYHNVGKHFVELEQWDWAIKAYKKLIEFQPDNIGYQLRLAYIYDEAGMKDQALDLYQVLIEERGKNPAYHAAIADYYLRNGNNQSALSEFKEAVRLWESAFRKSGAKFDRLIVKTWENRIRDLEKE